MYTPDSHIHDHSLIGIGTSVKTGWVKLVHSVKYNEKQTNTTISEQFQNLIEKS
jgi:hypothetical protein